MTFLMPQFFFLVATSLSLNKESGTSDLALQVPTRAIFNFLHLHASLEPVKKLSM